LSSGASRVRELPAYEFCKQGFVLGKASEAGFGNEMYKILTAAALSVMLNRSLIIGQTRHVHLLSIIYLPYLSGLNTLDLYFDFPVMIIYEILL
jgi:phosphatidate phosphatase PAH1